MYGIINLEVFYFNVGRFGMMYNVVSMGLKLRILPDEDMIGVLEQNIGNARFVWNHILSEYNELYKKFKAHGYPLKTNLRNFNAILNLLKDEFTFLREGESTSQQQVYRDLNKAFSRYFKKISGYPNFKSKRKATPSFRIQKNGNNIKVTNKRIRLAKLGYIRYQTSPKYRKLLKTSEINNVTVKRENGKYYAIVNVYTVVSKLKPQGASVGIDLGLKDLATLSNGLEIANLDLKREDKMIRKYQKKLSRQKYMSNNYQKTLKTYHKWVDKKNNKLKNAYHHLSKYIVKTFDLISMETLNIKGWFQNKKWSPKLQRIALYKLIQMIQYKAEWYGKDFIQIDRFFPSTLKCHNCQHQQESMPLNIRKWTCPKCGKHHHRDINAAINIKNEGIKIKYEHPIKTPTKI